MEDDTMLTTYDNPFNPFTDFETWWKFDHLLMHNTCELLAMYANPDPNVSDEINDQWAVEAMNTIVYLEPTIYKIVSKKDYVKNG